METARVCNKCRTEKPIEEFYRNTPSLEGRLRSCRDCVLSRQANYATTDRGKRVRKKAQHKYYQTEHGRAKGREQTRKWAQTEKGRAYMATREERGRSLPVVGEKACRICGDTKPLTEFHAAPRNWDGRDTRCKLCVKAHNQAYRQTPAGKQAKKRSNQKEKETPGYKLRNQVRNHKKRAEGVLGTLWWIETLALFKGRCAYCGSDQRITVEHVEPVSRGGTNDRENIVPACSSCNASKGPRFLLEWVLSNPEWFTQWPVTGGR